MTPASRSWGEIIPLDAARRRLGLQRRCRSRRHPLGWSSSPMLLEVLPMGELLANRLRWSSVGSPIPSAWQPGCSSRCSTLCLRAARHGWPRCLTGLVGLTGEWAMATSYVEVGSLAGGPVSRPASQNRQGFALIRQSPQRWARSTRLRWGRSIIPNALGLVLVGLESASEWMLQPLAQSRGSNLAASLHVDAG